MNVLITGANRGIGLGLAEHYLAKGARVFAAARNPDGARELWEHERDYGSRCRIVRLDVTDGGDIAALPDALGDAPLDLLINNAGVMPEKESTLLEVGEAAMLKAFRVNVLGPLRVTQALLPALRRGRRPTVATLTSRMGSIDDNSEGGYYSYRISKTAVNMLNRNLSLELQDMICVVLHPGWVETQMGGPGAPVKVDESAEGLARVIEGLKPQDSGRFFDFRGREIPW